MWRKSTSTNLHHFTTNELLSELLKRGKLPLLPATEEDQMKIDVFKTFWQRLSPTEMLRAFNCSQPVKKDVTNNA